MTSIIAMKPVRAWFLFALGMSFPVLMLELAAEETSRSWTEQTREFMVTDRARSAVEIRDAYDQAEKVSEKALNAIPVGTNEMDALAALGAAPNPFAVGFVFTKNRQLLLVPGGITPPERDLEALKLDPTLWVTASSDPKTYTDRRMTFYTSTGDFVVARSLKDDVVAGWLVDEASIINGAQPHLSHDVLIERAPLEGVGHIDSDVVVGFQVSSDSYEDDDAGAGNGVNVGVGVQKRKKVRHRTTDVTTENLTHFTVATKQVYRVAMKPEELEKFEHILLRLRQSAFGMVSACLLALVVAAASFFWRARKAQKLADLRTDFVAAVSHELRTPLASVRMFAELLEAGDVPEDERKEVETVLAGETRRLNATLDRMLRFGALARGKLVIEKRSQAIRPILEEAAKHRNVTIECDPSLEGNVDGGMLGNAVDNLLSNAVKYAPSDEPYVVRARGEKKMIVIDVIDHGPGLSRKAQRKIFLPFERADARLSKATEGSGVGLALVRGIAQAHGGNASVSSKVGQGATFTLRLRRV